jgi:hypothetical protein
MAKVVWTAVVLRCGKKMETLPHYHFSWIVCFQKLRYHVCEMLGDRRGYSHLKEEALDRIKWRNRFGRGFGPVVWRITDDDVWFLLTEALKLYKHLFLKISFLWIRHTRWQKPAIIHSVRTHSCTFYTTGKTMKNRLEHLKDNFHA